MFPVSGLKDLSSEFNLPSNLQLQKMGKKKQKENKKKKTSIKHFLLGWPLDHEKENNRF